jgi:hypothetical protein
MLYSGYVLDTLYTTSSYEITRNQTASRRTHQATHKDVLLRLRQERLAQHRNNCSLSETLLLLDVWQPS